MDTDLLCQWLGLPPGSWPPTPEALLGNSGDAQEQAVRLMEKLRPHQLRHPELVTEGMNRLAQALNVLEKRARQPANDPAAAATKSQPVPALDDFPHSTRQPGFTPETQSQPLPKLEGALEAIILEPKPAKRKRKKRQAGVQAPAQVVIEPVNLPPLVLPERDRRASYRRLVRLRRVLRAWTDLGPIIGVPGNQLDQSLDVLRFLQASADARAAIEALGEGPPQQNAAWSLVLHPASLAILHEMQPRQRQTLALEWACNLAQWRREIDRQRQALRVSKPRPSLRHRFAAARRRLSKRPELTLAGVLASLLIIAVARSIRF